jgi:hypothetical protein
MKPQSIVALISRLNVPAENSSRGAVIGSALSVTLGPEFTRAAAIVQSKQKCTTKIEKESSVPEDKQGD